MALSSDVRFKAARGGNRLPDDGTSDMGRLILGTEPLPQMDGPLPPRPAIRKAPSSPCDVLNADTKSPFRGMIKRASSAGNRQRGTVVADTGAVDMIQESLMSSSGCLFPQRDFRRGETDYDGLIQALVIFWTTIRDTFPEAWGKPPEHSRLMHGAKIKVRAVSGRESSVQLIRNALTHTNKSTNTLNSSPHTAVGSLETGIVSGTTGMRLRI